MQMYDPMTTTGSNGSDATSTGGAAPTGQLFGGMDMATISALVVLASAFMRR